MTKKNSCNDKNIELNDNINLGGDINIKITEKNEKKLQPPVAKRIHHVTTQHNRVVRDNYQWMRDGYDEGKYYGDNVRYQYNTETLNYLQEEIVYHRAFEIENSQYQALFEQEISQQQQRSYCAEQLDYFPVKVKEYYYFATQSCNKSTNKFQTSIYRNKSLSTPIDNEVSELILTIPTDYTNDIYWSISPNGNYISYQFMYIGNLFIYDIEAKKHLSDTAKLTDIDQVGWSSNLNKLFYIGRDTDSKSRSLFCHTIDENTQDDIQIIRHTKDGRLFYIGKDNKEVLIRADVSSFSLFPIKSSSYEDSEAFYLGLYVTDTTAEQGKEVYVLKENENNREVKKIPIQLIENQDIYKLLHYSNGYFYLLEGLKISRIASDKIMAGTANASDIVPYVNCEILLQGDEKKRIRVTINSIALSKDYLLLNIEDDRAPKIIIKHLRTDAIKTIPLPTSGKEPIISEAQIIDFVNNGIMVKCESLKQPSIYHQYNPDTDIFTPFYETTMQGYNPKDYTIKYMTVIDQDSEIKMAILYKTSLLKQNGENPCMVNAYGSYGAYAFRNEFNISPFSLVDRGFIHVVVYPRGSGFYGNERSPWHIAGKGAKNKRQTADDIITCCQHLASQGYSSLGNYSFQGGSAGGTLALMLANLAGTTIFKACIANVPAADVINQIPKWDYFNATEFGNPNNATEFAYMLQYNPYHSIVEKEYPALFVQIGLRDDRIPAWSPLACVAKLRERKTDNNLLLANIDLQGDHFFYNTVQHKARAHLFILYCYDMLTMNKAL